LPGCSLSDRSPDADCARDSIGGMARKKEHAVELSSLRPDLAAAAGRLGSRLRDPGELVPVAAHLRDDETVRFVTFGSYARNSGVLVLTDVRIVFFDRRVQTPSLDQSLGEISKVTTTSGLWTGEVDLEVGEDVVAVARIVKADIEPLAHAVRQAVAAVPAEAARPPMDPAELIDPFVAMEKLSALRDSGVLTEAEFAAKKQELLDRL
jgi:hypothetical protein